MDLLGTHAGVISNRALEILALLFSNNPNIQEAGARRGAMETFLRLVQDSGAGSESRSKAFRALVALVRQMAALEEKLIREKDGIRVIISCADQSDPRLCEKVASFARSLATDGRLQAEDVASLATALTPLLGNIGSGQIQYRETLSSCVCELARVAPAACPSELKTAAKDRLKQLFTKKEADDSEQEQSNLKEFLTLLTAGNGA